MTQLTEMAGAGIDRIESSVTLTLAANVENLTLLGSAAINGTGNALANMLAGNAGGNVLAGAGGSDVYVGGGGNDSVNTGGSAVERIAFARGHGNDLVTGSGTAREDRLELSGGVASQSVVLRRSSNNLVVDVGAGESVTLSNYYSGARHVGTLRIVNDAGWVAGQSGTPQIFADFDLAALAGGLANGAGIGLGATSVIGADAVSDLAAPGPLPRPISAVDAEAIETGRPKAVALPESTESWWSTAPETLVAPLNAAQFAEAAHGAAVIIGAPGAAPQQSWNEAPHPPLAPLLQALDVVAANGDALPRAAIRSAWEHVYARSDGVEVVELLGGERTTGQELLQDTSLPAAVIAQDDKQSRLTWWRPVLR